MRRVLLQIGMALLVAISLIAGCESVGTPIEQDGRVTIRVVDANTDAYDRVYLTVRRVELFGSDASGESVLRVVSDEERFIELSSDHNGVSVLLADRFIPAGHYHRLRVVLGDDSAARLADGTRVKISPDGEPVFTVTLPELHLPNGEEIEIGLDLSIDVNDDVAEPRLFVPTARASLHPKP